MSFSGLTASRFATFAKAVICCQYTEYLEQAEP